MLFPLPPGPPKFPIIGNFFDMPTEKEWLTFAQWGEKYGKLSSVTGKRASAFILLGSF
ncbi:hypothetical protein BT96DRAFT_1010472 [Gymnopus androsaceus JB14]|uniref:Cytochrome P450 n=1 Tax=Gymnopus androsaceus JB14 TaxID=1447944 RepID=A0A6A4GAM1_9AGAR|nr:hypothetical protein BT96DRAFT_1010472 [Gymnopus androsaceus JB14]